MPLAPATDPRGIEGRGSWRQVLGGKRAPLGFPFRDPHQTILDSQRVDRRLVQPSRQTDPPALSGPPSSHKHRLVEGDGQLPHRHTNMVAPDSYPRGLPTPNATVTP